MRDLMIPQRAVVGAVISLIIKGIAVWAAAPLAWWIVGLIALAVAILLGEIIWDLVVLVLCLILD